MSNCIFSILCEEVREEVQGTRTLVGVFSPEGLALPSLPHILPKFGIFIISESTEIKKLNLELEILEPKGSSLFRIQLPPKEPTSKISHYYINISPLQIKHLGTYLFKIKREDSVETETKLIITGAKKE